MKIITSFRVGFVLILLVTLASCHGKFMTDQGRVVAKEKRIGLQQEGSESGSWQGRTDLTVNYTTTRTGNVLQIAGDIVFNWQELLDTFRISLVLIDSNGSVLDVVPITSAGGNREAEQVSFSRELTLPPEAHSFAFAYNGVSRGIGTGQGSPTSFSLAPW
jgi:hypothetical protein